jgi:hypothetical protein
MAMWRPSASSPVAKVASTSASKLQWNSRTNGSQTFTISGAVAQAESSVLDRSLIVRFLVFIGAAGFLNHALNGGGFVGDHLN